jgi:MFS family permease
MGSFGSLRYRDYRLLWTGAVLSNTGTWMQAVAVSWFVLELTHSPFWVSFVSFANFFPIVLSPLGGVYADRMNRKRILMAAQGFMMTAAAVLAVLAWLDRANLGVVLGLTFAQGLGFAINGPTWMAFIPSLVPPDGLVSAIALNSAQFSLARVIGPAVAGAMIPLTGVPLIFTINAVSFVAVLVALVRMAPDRVPPPRSARTVGELLRGGFSYVRRNPRIRSMIVAIAVVAFFAGPIQAIFPIYASEVFGRGAGAYGALAASLGIGAVAGALAVGRSGARRGPRAVAGAMIAIGIVLVVFATVRSYPVGLMSAALIGCAYLYLVAAANSDVQVRVDELVRGRVMSISMLAFGLPFPIGSLIAGVAVEAFGAPTTTVIGAVACVLWGLAMLWSERGPAPRLALDPGD